jgi:peptide/nickel transport system permease protein
MAGFLLRRTLQSVAILFVVATLTFFLVHLAPGNPVDAMVDDPRVPESVRLSLRELYGVDKPLPVQYARQMSGLARGDLGFSISQHQPVAAVLAQAVPNTMLLMGVSLVLAFALGIAVGAMQGARAGSRFDRVASVVTTTFATLPDFWLGTGIMLLFAYRWGLFPVSGMVDPVMHPMMSPAARAIDVVRHLALPALSLVLIVSSVVARYQRAAMLDVWHEEFLRTAQAAGVPRPRRIFRHALRNALLPIVTLAGLSLPSMVGGALFVETVFAWPGMGRLAVEALTVRDHSLVFGIVLVASALVAIGGILADVVQAIIDPRLRHA